MLSKLLFEWLWIQFWYNGALREGWHAVSGSDWNLCSPKKVYLPDISLRHTWTTWCTLNMWSVYSLTRANYFGSESAITIDASDLLFSPLNAATPHLPIRVCPNYSYSVFFFLSFQLFCFVVQIDFHFQSRLAAKFIARIWRLRLFFKNTTDAFHYYIPT